MIGSFWSLMPAIVAIALALITKEVYSSLFVGIIMGGVFFVIGSGGGFSGFLNHVLNDGFVSQLSDSYNVGILIFLVLLGILVTMMKEAGGSAAFGNWAKKHIKSRVGAQVATICLGVLLFIDDYFNCLTVGTVMKPVTDRYRVSKEKLAYLIDSTAAPICIIAPISSWAAAVSGFVTEGENGISLFCKAIPFNFYAIFTIIMMFAMVFMRFEFGKMSEYEKALEMMNDELEEDDNSKKNANVFDLIIPIAALIVLCVLGMIYSGGIFDKESDCYGNFIEAFANSDASVGLVIGSFGAYLVTVIYFLCRKVITFKRCMACIPDGFKSMVPAILILTFAWTLKEMTGSLGAKDFVAGLVSGSASSLKCFLPAIIFAIACFLAFATGTSWGTFGILIPICIAAFPESSDPIRIISISACMAGAVCGDHCSPISDTTIMSSAGAQCEHVNHVSSQLPYAITVAVISFLTYIVAGLTQMVNIYVSGIVSLIFGVVCLFCFLFFMKIKLKKSEEKKE